ncbi:MAG: hypothetical protein ACI4SO_03865, partial [Muribaculaceae bacterium]
MTDKDNNFEARPLYNDENVSCFRIDDTNKERIISSLPEKHISLLGCSCGELEMHLGAEVVKLTPMEVMFINKVNQKHEVFCNKDFMGFVLSISERLLMTMLKFDKGLQQVYIRLRQNRIIPVNEGLNKVLGAYANLMESKLTYSHYYLRETTYSILQAMLYDILASVLEEVQKGDDY